MDRIRWINAGAQGILLLDVSYCPAEKVMSITEQVQTVISKQPIASVLVLADFTGAQFNREAVARIKEVAALDRPYVKREAWVGSESLPRVWFSAIQRFSQRELVRFETRDEAVKYLLAE